MEKILLIDGNSMMNRAFYGVMAGKNMMTADGKYTNALYGFLAILFKNIEELNPDYILVAFDSKTAADVRKQKYEGYKKNRHKMPGELAEQMPEIKEILDAMNIRYLEMSDFEGDDILGSAAKQFAGEDKTSYILSGDRDLFQLAQDNIIIRIPRTKAGKTETEVYDKARIEEEYGLSPQGLIELKALMGDSSDEIPGIPGVGPKTATDLLKKYNTVDALYKAVESDEDSKEFKPGLRNKLIENKHLAEISKDIGTINTKADLGISLQDIKTKEWDKQEVLRLFKIYKFNRFIERFNLNKEADDPSENINQAKEISEVNTINRNSITDVNLKDNKMIYFLETAISSDESKIIKKDIIGVGIYENEKTIAYIKNPKIEELKHIFENEQIEKIGYKLSEDYVLLKENGISAKNIKYDIEVAEYDINPSDVKHKLNEIAEKYLNINLDNIVPEKQITLFDTNEDKNEIGIYVYVIKRIYEETKKILEKNNTIKLFQDIEIPLITVLGEMQYNGMKAELEKLIEFGCELKKRMQELTKEIHEIAGEEFNVNSTKQLGDILFEKLKLPAPKKKKNGYSTDVDTLEKLRGESPIIEMILEYRTISKLNSTYVEGLTPYINKKTGRIHSYFHQTITATGRISSTEPNLQNIPAREELGRNIKKAFVPQKGYVYIDADYSQIELRVLAHIANDEKMIEAFRQDEDIHTQVASRVFSVPAKEVTKEQRSKAKAVNFGIVYGISDFGLAGQIGTSRKEAKEYIDNYLKKYPGIKKYMDDITAKAKEDGYVETLFGRRRYIPELKSSNYMVREFGKRVALNAPIQGTAADIMKIAMNEVYRKLKEKDLDAKLILQVHDELMIEVKKEQKEEAKKILKDCMENAAKLSVPLKVEANDAEDWYNAK